MTPYYILGYSHIGNDCCLVVSQPYKQFQSGEVDKVLDRIVEKLKSRYNRILTANGELWVDNMLIDNLNGKNVGICVDNGHEVVVDCLISNYSEERVKELWHRIGCTSAVEYVLVGEGDSKKWDKRFIGLAD